MQILPLLSGIYILLIIIIPVFIFYTIYKWVTKIISLKEEQNNLLREISIKMDHK
jgi:hypothetical protein